MIITISISLAALLVISLAAIFIRSRRAAAKNHAPDSAKRRAAMDDCGDDAVWEAGKRRSIAAAEGFEARLTKRAFLRRVAFGVPLFLFAWLASRGKSAAAFDLETRAGKGRFAGKTGPHTEDWTTGPHTDSTVHNDDHTDSGGGDHGDVHGDGQGNHTDAGG